MPLAGTGDDAGPTVQRVATPMRKERRDANEAEIIAALREAGCEVWQMCKDEPADLLVLPQDPELFGRLGYVPTYPLMLLEVKDGSKPPSARKLTPKQVDTHKVWPVIVVEDVQQALQAIRGGV